MNAITAFLCIITFSLVSMTVPGQFQITAASGSDGGSAPDRSRETGKPVTPQKADPNRSPGTAPTAAKPNQMPVPPDPGQVVEERLRSGQIEKPIALGEISDRLNQLYSGSSRATGETAAEHASR
jgi:hypothetical protein